MSMESAPDTRPSPRADLWSAIVWIVLGGAIVVGSWNMDRLERMGATLYTAPGLVPGLLGACILLLGVQLALRSVRGMRSAQPADIAHSSVTAYFSGRVALVFALCLFYGLVLVGRGVPFWLATFLFVTGFVLILEYPKRRERGQLGRGVAMALVYGVATSAVVSTVFEHIFLVRLP
jgi:Tripartite tricarboxylate transporter TctB family